MIAQLETDKVSGLVRVNVGGVGRGAAGDCFLHMTMQSPPCPLPGSRCTCSTSGLQFLLSPAPPPARRSRTHHL